MSAAEPRGAGAVPIAGPPESPRSAPPRFTEAEAIAAAGGFADSIAGGAAQRDRRGVAPRAELAEFDHSGLLGMTVPRAYGGPGLGPTALAEVTRTIAAADPAVAQTPQGHFLFVDVIALLGSGAQREYLFGEVLSGARIGNALAERGTKHAQDLRTRLTADGAGNGNRNGALRLTGRKYYATGALTARWIAVTAIDDAGRLMVAFVGREDEGVHVTEEDWDVIGQRSTASGSAEFDDVRVDPELVLPYWCAFEGPQLLGARAQLVHAAIEVGIAGGALADARDFVRTRSRPFFEAVRGGWAEQATDDPHTRLSYGRLATQVQAAEELLRWAARELAEIGLHPANGRAAARGSLAVAKAKAFGSETAVHVAGELFALSGASAADARHALDRHWRNARIHSIHEPVDWKYHHIGAYELGDQLPPNHGQL
jgi:SfnB family sulfur acquisition oxidoreductase